VVYAAIANGAATAGPRSCDPLGQPAQRWIVMRRAKRRQVAGAPGSATVRSRIQSAARQAHGGRAQPSPGRPVEVVPPASSPARLGWSRWPVSGRVRRCVYPPQAG
jgi:hypothetical protein